VTRTTGEFEGYSTSKYNKRSSEALANASQESKMALNPHKNNKIDVSVRGRSRDMYMPYSWM